MSDKGRPTKLTPETHEKVINAIRAGNYLETAAEYGGVTRQTLWNWMQRGEAEKARVAEDGRRSVTKDERPYVNFFHAVTRARAEAETRNVALIQQASHEDWRAAAWFLERSFQKRWGNKQKIEHTGQLNVQHLIAELPPAEVERLLGMPEDELREELKRLGDGNG